MKSRSSN